MTPADIRSAVHRVLGRIAPEADLEHIEVDSNLRDQLDIDSVDFLNFVVGLHKELSIDIPEKDYPQMSTLESCIAYLTRRLVKP